MNTILLKIDEKVKSKLEYINLIKKNKVSISNDVNIFCKNYLRTKKINKIL